MTLVSPTQSNPNDEIKASAINNPVNQLAAVLNGHVDDDNISAVSGSKVTSGTLPGTALDATARQGWITGVLPAVSSVANNGQGSEDILFASTVATILYPGMRLRTSRTVTAPTQVTSLNGTNQYWSRLRASLTGTLSTITDDLTFNVWLKPGVYQAGALFALYNGTSGVIANLNASGQVSFFGYNGGAGNNRGWTSAQSVNLSKGGWLSGSLDMSGFTSTTNKCMFGGVDVPITLSQAGTNPTAFVNVGDLNVGAQNGTSFLSGKVGQLWLGSGNASTITQATLRGYQTYGLTGAETNCIGFWSFNGNGNDGSSSANNLTANGSAVATNADSPFAQDANGVPGGTYDYAIVTAVSGSTATVQVPEGNAIPTSGGVSAVAYSTNGKPAGMPLAAGKWNLSNTYKSSFVQSSPVTNTWYNLSFTTGVTGGAIFTLPVGPWKLGHRDSLYGTKAASTGMQVQRTLSTANNTESETLLTVSGLAEGASGQMTVLYTADINMPVSVTSQTLYYLNWRSTTASAVAIGSQSGNSSYNPCVIYAEFGLL